MAKSSEFQQEKDARDLILGLKRNMELIEGFSKRMQGTYPKRINTK